MLAKRIVACLDVRAGRVVKGRRFQNLIDAGDAVAKSRDYCDQGVDEIVVLDVSATLEERIASQTTIAAIAREIDVPLTAGGGVRSVSDFKKMLDAGADKVAINSAAIESPALIEAAAERYGRQCVVLSIDAVRNRGGYTISTRSATNPVSKDAVEWAKDGQRLGAGEILLTAVDRDGTQSGFDLELIAAVSDAVRVPVIASGGGSDSESFARALLSGAQAALGASRFHDGSLSIGAVKSYCSSRGLVMRL